jgi:hypothetical protein
VGDDNIRCGLGWLDGADDYAPETKIDRRILIADGIFDFDL